MSNYVNISNSCINLGSLISNNPVNLVSLVATTNSILQIVGGTSNTCLITGVSNPINSTDVANKAYVDTKVSSSSGSLYHQIVYQSNNQSISRSTMTLVRFNTTLEFTASMFNFTTNCFVAPVNGLYSITCQVGLSGANRVSLYMRKNGSTDSNGYIMGHQSVLSGYDCVLFHAVLYLNTNDYISANIWYDSTVTGTTPNSITVDAGFGSYIKSYFQMTKVG